MQIICYKKCGTCRKLEKNLQIANIDYEYREIDIENPQVDEIRLWHEKSKLDIKHFFNSSGKIYRELNLKDKLKSMSLEDKYTLLASNGMLVKRPIILYDDEFYIGPVAVKFGETVAEQASGML